MKFILIALFCAIGGSFFNMLIYRLNNNVPLLKPAFSMCPKCRHRLRLRDLLPIASFLLLGGHCRYCHKKIPLRYLLIEIIFVGIGVIGALSGSSLLNLLLYMFLVGIFFSDLEYKEIPYFFSGTAALLVIILQRNSLPEHLWGLCFVLVFGLFIKLIEKLFYQKEVFGGGDILLFGILAIYFPLNKFLLFFYLSFLLGMTIALLLMFKQKASLKSYLPFAPYIVIAFFIVEYAGKTIIDNYWRFFNV